MGPQPGSPVRNALATAVEWLRAGYPEHAPPTGFSPLMALCGPVSLTSSQLNRAVTALGDRTPSAVDIDVAITVATHRLPTPSQRCAVSRALRPPPP